QWNDALWYSGGAPVSRPAVGSSLTGPYSAGNWHSRAIAAAGVTLISLPKVTVRPTAERRGPSRQHPRRPSASGSQSVRSRENQLLRCALRGDVSPMMTNEKLAELQREGQSHVEAAKALVEEHGEDLSSWAPSVR